MRRLFALGSDTGIICSCLGGSSRVPWMIILSLFLMIRAFILSIPFSSILNRNLSLIVSVLLAKSITLLYLAFKPRIAGFWRISNSWFFIRNLRFRCPLTDNNDRWRDRRYEE